MKVKLLTIATVNAALLAMSSSAWAAVSFDQNVATPPGVFFGTGNNNGGFAVDNAANNIQIGLRAKLDHQNVFPDNNNGIYIVPVGAGIDPTRASWNYEFSINVNADGTGSANLGQFTYALMLDSDPSAATSFGPARTFDPVAALNDNSYANSTSSTATVGGSANAANFSAVENSENAAFFGAYDPNAPGIYDIVLEVLNSDHRVVAAVDIQVDVVATPDVSATAPLLGLALGGLALVSRKLRRQA